MMMITFPGHQGHGNGLPDSRTDVGVLVHEASSAENRSSSP